MCLKPKAPKIEAPPPAPPPPVQKEKASYIDMRVATALAQSMRRKRTIATSGLGDQSQAVFNKKALGQ